mgnify:CR=1 FL=1
MGAKLTVRPYNVDDNDEKVYGAELVYSGYEYCFRTLAKTSKTTLTLNLARTLAMYIHAAYVYSYDA